MRCLKGCVDSVNFRTLDFGGAFFNRSYCVLCAPWVLRCRMFIFCVKEADWDMTAFVAYLGFQNSTPCLSTCAIHNVACKQHPCPSNARRWFRSGHFRLLGQEGGGVMGVSLDGGGGLSL